MESGQDSNPVAGYGASWGLFPQSIPRWARAEALDRPTGTTVAALDARRRVPRRPDVVQLDAGEIAGNDRVPLGGRVRPSPSPPGGRRSRRRGQLLASRPSTCAGGNFQESGPRPSKSPISRRSGRNRRAMTGREALGAVRVGCLSPPKNRSCPPTGGPGGRVRRRPRPVDEVAPSSTSTEDRTQSPRGHGHTRCSFFVGGVVGPKAARSPPNLPS